ncbi:MAG: hypothetical protein JST75_11915 [Bacteroidetes bacterium]|nr:hypothetical protein [Bacteroidota bacterium]
MKPVILFLITQSIWIPIIIGLVRFKTIKEELQPFFWTLVAGLFTEVSSFIIISNKAYASNAIPSNIFVVVEWILLSYQFHIWGFLKKRKRLFYLLLTIPTLIWVIENLVFGKITAFSPYFRILYSFLLTLMSITEINFKITHDNKNLFRNPRFIICIGFILFFVYQLLYEWSYQVSLVEEPSKFTSIIISLFTYMDAATNIIFGIAFLVIPRHKEYKLE